MQPPSREAGLHVARPQRSRRPLIIERPDLQTWAQRYGYLSLTFLFWFLWLYLFVPLLALVAWALGATLVYQVMIQGLDTAELLRLLKSYGSGAGALSATYLAWAVTSWARFRSGDRRRATPLVTDATLADSHRLTVTELAELRRGRRLVISADQLGRMFGQAPVLSGNGQDDHRDEPRRADAG